MDRTEFRNGDKVCLCQVAVGCLREETYQIRWRRNCSWWFHFFCRLWHTVDFEVLKRKTVFRQKKGNFRDLNIASFSHTSTIGSTHQASFHLHWVGWLAPSCPVLCFPVLGLSMAGQVWVSEWAHIWQWGRAAVWWWWRQVVWVQRV